MAAARELITLQSVDNDLDVRQCRLGEIAPLIGNDTAIQRLTARIEGLEKDIDAALLRQQEYDSVIDRFSAKIKAAETKLYSGTINNSRELQDLQADIGMLNRQRSEQEDLLLLVLEELEGVQSSHGATVGRLSRAQVSWGEDQHSLEHERMRLLSEIGELEQKRVEIVSRIPPSETSLYERIRGSHKGNAIARLRNNNCDACLVGVPNKDVQDIKSAPEPVRCPNCGRILLPE